MGERLGGGGMGTVYRATRRDGGPDRAVKLLRPELAEDPVILARFVQERVLMLALRGPNLVVVEDLIVDGDMVAIVMELVTGGTLRGYLKSRGRLDELTALNAIRQVLLGLGVVHGHGIVHRDLKPENVLLATSTEVTGLTAKVTDFGIARALDGPHLTGAFDYVGTPHYSAPEVAEGRIPTPAADVYAAGVMLYELLSGATPFAGEAWFAVIKKQIEQSPPRPGVVSDPSWALISRWMSPDPARRPADAWEALRELDALTAALGGRSNPSPVGPVSASGTPPPMESSYGPSIPAPSPPIYSMPGQGAFSPAAQAGMAKAENGPATSKASARTSNQLPAAPSAEFLEVVHENPRVVQTPAAFTHATPLPSHPSHPGNPSNHPSIVPGFGPSAPVGFGAPGGPGSPETTLAAAPSRRHTKAIAIGAACIVLAGAIGGGALLLGGGKSTPKEFSLQFPTGTYPASGVTVDRTWTLTGGKHPSLHGLLVFHTSKAVSTQIEEVLPAALVADGNQVTFDPQPLDVESGRVVRYALPATPGLTITDSYDVSVSQADVSMTVLQRWADDQSAEAGARYRAAQSSSHKLRTIRFALRAIKLDAGSSTFLPVNGTQADGAPAPTVALGGIHFLVANPRIATVTALGLVKGLSKGITTIRATLGPLTAIIRVEITAAPAGQAPTSPENLAPGVTQAPAESTAPAAKASASVAPFVGGAPSVAAHSGQAKPVHKAKPKPSAAVTSPAVTKATPGPTSPPPTPQPDPAPTSVTPDPAPPTSEGPVEPTTAGPTSLPPTSEPPPPPPSGPVPSADAVPIGPPAAATP